MWCHSGLSSRHTSFVAVDLSEQRAQAAMESRHVSNQMPHGWGGMTYGLAGFQGPMRRGGGSGAVQYGMLSSSYAPPARKFEVRL